MVTVAIPQGYVGLHTAPSVLQAAPTVPSTVAGQDVAASGEVAAAELELQPVEEPAAATTPTARPMNIPTNERDTSKVIPLHLGNACHIPSPVRRSNAICATLLQRTRTAVPGSMPWGAG